MKLIDVLKKRWRLVTGVVVTLVLLGGVAVLAVDKLTGLPDNAVLQVGDTVISQQDFDHRVRLLRALYGVQSPENGDRADQFRRDAAKSIAVSLIVTRAAEERGIVIAERTAQQALDRLVKDQFPAGRDAFIESLGTVGASEREVLAEIGRQLASSRLFDEITKDVAPVTDADVRKHYKDHKADMVTPEKRRLRNIVVRTREDAQKVYAQARKGADFASLAARRSLDQSTKTKGGDLGTRTADQLEGDFAKAAFAAGKGAVFGPVQTQYGWNVGKVENVRAGDPLAFDQVAEQLKEELNNLRRVEAWRKWFSEELKAAEVEYADDYRPANPDAPPSAPLQ